MVDLNYLSAVVRKMIKEIDGDHVRQFQEGFELAKVIEFLKHLKFMVFKGSV